MTKKQEYLLVDGYNIIFSWDELKSIAESSLEDARVKLTEVLSEYQGAAQIEVLLVFDAHKVKKNPGSMERYGNLTVVYTKEAQTADQYIERTASGLVKDYAVRVATSDYLEQIIILGHGASRISAAGLLNEINALKQHNREKFIDNRLVKRNMLLDNVDAKTAEMLERMRRHKGG